MIVGLFVGIWVARYLGPEQFGLFAYAQSFVGLFTAIATLGLDGIVVRELVKDEGRRDELIGTAFWLKLMGALTVLIVLATAVNFTSNDSYTNSLVFIIASATIFQSFNVVDMYFQSKVLSKYVVYVNVISLFISSIVKIGLILNEAPLIAFAWVILFDSFILACGFIYFYLKNRPHSEQPTRLTVPDTEISFAWKFNPSTALSLLKDSWPLILSGIVISIYMKIDQVMIKEMMNAEAVGQYSAAVKIAEIFLIPISVLISSLAPYFYKRKSHLDEYESYEYLSQFMTIIGALIVFIIVIGSDFLINLLLGHEYNQTSDVLKIIIFSIFLVYTTAPFGGFFIAHNRTVVTLVVTVISVVSNIALNLVLIPLDGIMGAAYATFFARAITSAALFFIERKLFWIQVRSLLFINLFRKKNIF